MIYFDQIIQIHFDIFSDAQIGLFIDARFYSIGFEL